MERKRMEKTNLCVQEVPLKGMGALKSTVVLSVPLTLWSRLAQRSSLGGGFCQVRMPRCNGGAVAEGLGAQSKPIKTCRSFAET